MSLSTVSPARRHEDLSSQKFERMSNVLGAVSDGCKCCKKTYGEVLLTLFLGEYDSVSAVFEGDGHGGFCVETGDKRVAADQIGKELRCVIRDKSSDAKGKVKISNEGDGHF